MLLQTNSYVVPKDKRAEHARLVRRFRQTLAKLGCDHFEVYEQVSTNWAGEGGGRCVQIMRFRDRKHQTQVQSAERTDPTAQALIREFCELINFPYQQQQGLFAVGFYLNVLPLHSANEKSASRSPKPIVRSVRGVASQVQPPNASAGIARQLPEVEPAAAPAPTELDEWFSELAEPESVAEADEPVAATEHAESQPGSLSDVLNQYVDSEESIAAHGTVSEAEEPTAHRNGDTGEDLHLSAPRELAHGASPFSSDEVFDDATLDAMPTPEECSPHGQELDQDPDVADLDLSESRSPEDSPLDEDAAMEALTSDQPADAGTSSGGHVPVMRLAQEFDELPESSAGAAPQEAGEGHSGSAHGEAASTVDAKAADDPLSIDFDLADELEVADFEMEGDAAASSHGTSAGSHYHQEPEHNEEQHLGER